MLYLLVHLRMCIILQIRSILMSRSKMRILYDSFIICIADPLKMYNWDEILVVLTRNFIHSYPGSKVLIHLFINSTNIY